MSHSKSHMKNLTKPIDINNACRACLKTGRKNMNSLFSLHKEEMLSKIFLAITSVKVEPEDNLPFQVCYSCREELIKSYKFRLKCQESENYMRSFLESEKNVDTTQPSTDTSSINCIRKYDEVEEAECTMEIKVEDEEEIEYLDEQEFNEEEKYLIERNIGRKNIISSETRELEKKSDKTKTTIKDNKFECEVCCKKFKNIETLNKHINKYHIQEEALPYPCKHCRESFSSEHDRHLHSALHTSVDNVWTCNKCQKVFKGRSALRRHVRYHMEHKRHACPCGKTFAERSALLRHARVHTGQLAEKNFVCQYCSKRFIDRAALGAHVARHTGSRAHLCDCGAAFRSARLLRSHRRVHDDALPHACDVCHKRFRHASTLRTHARTHTGERPYVCAACGKTFIQHSNLTLHARTHTGEKPYSCDFCGRKFSSGSTLRAHRRTHTGEKPYACPECGKRFARMDMTAHMRQHSGDRPHACAVCGKRFATAARRTQHMLVHTAEIPYECGECSEKFVRKAYLVRHMKSHMGETGKGRQTAESSKTSRRGQLGKSSLRGQLGKSSLRGQLGKSSLRGQLGKSSLRGQLGKSSLRGQLGKSSLRGQLGKSSPRGEPSRSNRVSVVQLAPPRENVIVSNYSIKTNERATSGDTYEAIPEHDHLDVSQELILDDSDVKNEVVVMDESSHVAYEEICLDSDTQYEPMEVVEDYQSKIEDEHIMYVDERYIQIEKVNGQLMISKITSE